MNENQVIWISSGANHSAIVLDSGQLLTCGSYLHKKLGIDDLQKDHISKFAVCSITQDFRIKKAVCGDYHTMALTQDGSVLAWGGTLHKKLGTDEENGEVPSIHIVKSLYKRKIVDICCGDFHSVALEESGSLYTWGGGGASYNKGQCGHGNFNDENLP